MRAAIFKAVGDPLAVVPRISSRFGIAMSADAEVRYQSWTAVNPSKGRFAHHHEVIARAAEISPAFEPHIERYAP